MAWILIYLQIMPRKPLIRSNAYPYHVTARCNNKEPFYIPLNEVWAIISNELGEVSAKFECRIHAFVLMPNHFHLLVSTTNQDLGVVMQNLMITITKKINRNSGRIGRVFGSRYHWTLIDNEHYFDCALKYVYRNPVKANLVELVEDYEFSTIKMVISNQFVILKMHPPIGHLSLIPNENKSEFLSWLNRPFPNEEYSAIKKAFQKTKFEMPKPGWRRKKVDV